MKKILLLAGVMATATAMAEGTDSLKGFRAGVNLNTVYAASNVAVATSKFNGSTIANGGDASKASFMFNQRPILGIGATVGYDFHRNFGLLFAYQYLGRRSVSGSDGTATTARGSLVADAWSLTGEGRLALVSALDLTARLGISMISNRLSVSRGDANSGSIFRDGSTYNIKATQWGLNYGLGFQYHINECTDIDAGVEAITPFTQSSISGTYYTRFYVGASYKF